MKGFSSEPLLKLITPKKWINEIEIKQKKSNSSITQRIVHLLVWLCPGEACPCSEQRGTAVGWTLWRFSPVSGQLTEDWEKVERDHFTSILDQYADLQHKLNIVNWLFLIKKKKSLPTCFLVSWLPWSFASEGSFQSSLPNAPLGWALTQRPDEMDTGKKMFGSWQDNYCNVSISMIVFLTKWNWTCKYLFFLQIFLLEQLVVYSLYHLTNASSQALKAGGINAD